MTIKDLKPGQKIRILQEVDRREGQWRNEVVGTILSVKEESTGSWYAHGKDDKYWLRRIRLQKENGELTTITVDQLTDVQILGEAPAKAH